MSFILDALKKLEREKETRGAGVVMVGPVQWGAPDRQRQRRRLLLGMAGLVVLAVGAGWWLTSRPDPTPTLPVTTTAPQASRAATPAPPTAVAEPALPEPTTTSSGVPGSPPALAIAAPPPRNLDLPVAHPAASHGLEAAPPAPPPSHPAAEAPEFRLTAISERDGRPIAILNDRLVREGDRFDDLRIIRIGAAEIEIEIDGQRRTIGF